MLVDPVAVELCVEASVVDPQPASSGASARARASRREVVRMAVASHPKSDVTVLMALSNDPSEAVRKAVSIRILNAVDGSLG